MGKLITITTENALASKVTATKFLKRMYEANNDSFTTTHGDLCIEFALSDFSDLVSQLKNISNAKVVYVHVVRTPKTDILEQPTDIFMKECQHFSRQIDLVHGILWPFNLILISDRFPEKAAFLTDMTLVVDKAGIYVKRIHNQYFSKYCGNELTSVASDRR